jgi:hypothetical protein
MVEEIIKNARVTSAGRRILSSIQKASIVEDGNPLAYLVQNFVADMGYGVQMLKQVL